jgi:hypothetical protein
MALDWQKANALIKRDLPVELKIGNDKRRCSPDSRFMQN